jgi:hypothetical protein
MPSSAYHLRRAQMAASRALVEGDRATVTRFQSLALRHFDEAEKTKADEMAASQRGSSSATPHGNHHRKTALHRPLSSSA